MLPIECVVRGYLSGSGWKDYQRDRRGLRVPPARRACASRTSSPEPIFTPTTKAQTGPRRDHRPRAGGRARRRRAVRRARAHLARALRDRAEYAAERGIIIADTKFELGLDEDGRARARRRGLHARLVALLAGRRLRAGRPQPSFDKQFVRDYAESLGWDKTPPGPELPDEVVAGTRRATSRRSSGSPASPSTTTRPTRTRCSR